MSNLFILVYETLFPLNIICVMVVFYVQIENHDLLHNLSSNRSLFFQVALTNPPNYDILTYLTSFLDSPAFCQTDNPEFMIKKEDRKFSSFVFPFPMVTAFLWLPRFQLTSSRLCVRLRKPYPDAAD